MTEFIQQLLYGVSNGANIALVAVGLSLMFGVYNVLNLAHGQMIMLGAFVTYVISTQLGAPFFVGMLVAMLSMGILGVFFEVTMFRRIRNTDSTLQLVLSLGLFFALGTVATQIWGNLESRQIALPGADLSVRLLGLSLNFGRLLVIGITLLLMAGLAYLTGRTHLGRTMRAMAQDRETADLMGIRTAIVGPATFFIASALGGAGGALLGGLFGVRPDMAFTPLLLGLVAVVVGGLESIWGALIASLVIGILQNLSIFYVSTNLGDLLPYSGLLLVLLLRPQGIFGVDVSRA